MTYLPIQERKIRCYYYFTKTCKNKKDCLGEDLTCIDYEPTHPSILEDKVKVVEKNNQVFEIQQTFDELLEEISSLK